MSKIKSLYICQNCGAQSASWMGKCNGCNGWNTLVEEVYEEKGSLSKKKRVVKFTTLSSISEKKTQRIKTGLSEIDLLLGGGIVQGSLNLLSGEPGVGKSTLLLQLAYNLAKQNSEGKILYISGEESPQQIKLRAQRLNKNDDFAKGWDSLLIGDETNIENIIYSIQKEKPFFLIIDSIQTVYSEKLSSYPGSVSQVRQCANAVLRVVKRLNIPTFIVGQVTKEGVVAGPKLLEHLVDVVLQFEGSEDQDYRLLRALKNRFGSTDEVIILKMSSSGLEEITNPSAIFLDDHKSGISGSVKTAFLDGNRALLVEIQALVVPNYFPPLRRTASGIDYNRLLLLIAVLERRLGVKLQNKDVYIKVSGGLKLQDPAVDLAICVAILSAYKNKVLDNRVVVVGEIGLLGELRKVRQVGKRKKEAGKQGFDMFISSNEFRNLKEVQGKLGFG